MEAPPPPATEALCHPSPPPPVAMAPLLADGEGPFCKGSGSLTQCDPFPQGWQCLLGEVVDPGMLPLCPSSPFVRLPPVYRPCPPAPFLPRHTGSSDRIQGGSELGLVHVNTLRQYHEVWPSGCQQLPQDHMICRGAHTPCERRSRSSAVMHVTPELEVLGSNPGGVGTQCPRR